jgi:hypothetical protein
MLSKRKMAFDALIESPTDSVHLLQSGVENLFRKAALNETANKELLCLLMMDLLWNSNNEAVYCVSSDGMWVSTLRLYQNSLFLQFEIDYLF